MRGLPVVDVRADLMTAGRVEQAAVLDHACRQVGLFEVVGHGVPSTDIASLFDVTRRFFDMPASAKAAVAQPAPDQVRGWSALGSEGIAYSLDEESPADLKEKFDMGRPDVPSVSTAGDSYFDPIRSGPHLAANLWPASPTSLRHAWEGYWRRMDRLCASLMTLTATAWGLPVDWFDDKVDRSISMLRALHYPAQHEAPLSGQLRAGAHTDYGAFTIITAENVAGGLQTLDRDGEWEPVVTTPGRMLVVVGDLLAEWTDDAWPATLHRVVNPPRGTTADTSRLAFAFYQHPNYDVAVDVLPPLRDEGIGPAHPAMTAGEHLRQKYLRQTTFGRIE